MKLYVRLPGGGEIRLEREPKEREPIDLSRLATVLFVLVPVIGAVGWFTLMILTIL